MPLSFCIFVSHYIIPIQIYILMLCIVMFYYYHNTLYSHLYFNLVAIYIITVY